MRLNVPIEDYIDLNFDFGMNILNYAIDQERCAIINHLARVTASRPEIKEKLVKNRFGTNEIQAIHQAVTIGNKALLDCIIRDFKADIDV